MMTTLRGCALLAIATFVGAAMFSVLDVLKYKALGLQPNMAPEMFVVFSPIIALPIVIIAVLIHSIFARQFGFTKAWHWMAAGLAYSSVLLGFINPWLLLIPLAVNPITIHLARRASRKGTAH
jgi:hypothetical protein